MRAMNLFDEIPEEIPTERVTSILRNSSLRIERIVSLGQSSPEGFWYDQDESEWVVVLKGAARLTVENETVNLKPGDWLNIPAHQKHRVEWTTPDEPTVWLAIFYSETNSH